MRTKTRNVATINFTCQHSLAERINAEVDALRRKFPGRIISRSAVIAVALDEALPPTEAPRHRRRVAEARCSA